MRARTARVIALFAMTILLCAGFVASPFASSGTPAAAATASNFNPANIISDAVFFNGADMDSAGVQDFLNKQYQGCTSGYTCLRDFKQTTPDRGRDAMCNNYSGGANESAATIVSKVGLACGINPKVLLVTLQKEQSLVTHTSPSQARYNIAMGYACPDTAACDAQYFGFFNQVYKAAWQLKRYGNPAGTSEYFTWFPVGKSAPVRYHPNASCGSASITVQNKATAALYYYTPYQPNAAALNNLYGTGDSCSAYGNRNFWRMFSDWFGDPTAASNLVRTADNPTVYLVSDGTKYPVRDYSMLDALYPLGTVGYVSQQFLDSKSTGADMKRIVRSASGKVYFFDVGAKFQFMTCDDVLAYGVDCGSSILLTDSQLAAFRNSQSMTRLFETTTGKKFLIEGGKKREVADQASLAAVDHPDRSMVLFEAAIAYLPYGSPIVRNSVFAKKRGGDWQGFLSGATISPISSGVATQTGLQSAFDQVVLDEQSIGTFTRAGAISGFVRDGSGQTFVLTQGGRLKVAAASYPGIEFVGAPAPLLSKLPVLASANKKHFLKGVSSPSVYLIEAGVKRKAWSWAAISSAEKSTDVSSGIWTVADETVASLSDGRPLLDPGTLVKRASSPRVFLVDGSTRLLSIMSFDVTMALGLGASVTTMPDGALDSFEQSKSLLSPAVTCNGRSLVGLDGKLLPTDAATLSAYGWVSTTLDPNTCALMKVQEQPLTKFLRGPDGKIYWVDGGKRHALNSWAALVTLGGVDKWIQASPSALNLIPLGDPIS
ncbi:hypothetical protein L1277_001769 [Okibacterium sp. HSC-33S16]|uniref:hypothetical protein n=1 Tax=Okibacterium sp. HSC-33S16 TaxID=2910965 RepID=UPI00209E818C|nr:hypothetical protein [Okibacterium sp. HSC-33S16]MCP2031671.1 hypothetical protein [Okibacterium sp. HSC-33S16]